MARPKPMTFFETHDLDEMSHIAVLSAPGVYAVYYRESPISVRTNKLRRIGADSQFIEEAPTNKYLRTCFSNPGHAFNLATRLNTLFSTDMFQVREMTDNQQIFEDRE